MKLSIKKVISVALVMSLVFLFASCDSVITKGAQYKENGDGYALYRYKSTSTETSLEIPDTYENKPVTELMAFSVANAEYLTEIKIGKNITKIDSWAFTNCPNLVKITVSEENPNYKTVDGVLYNKDLTELICYPNSKSPIKWGNNGEYVSGGEFTVPETVTVIKANAFYLCSNLYSIQFNEGLKSIEDMAFIKCTSLSELKLPSTLETIGRDAFSYCDALKTLDIPSSVKKIGDYGFFSTNSSIEKITVNKKSSDEIELGKDWIPNKKGGVRDKVPVEYVG